MVAIGEAMRVTAPVPDRYRRADGTLPERIPPPPTSVWWWVRWWLVFGPVALITLVLAALCVADLFGWR